MNSLIHRTNENKKPVVWQKRSAINPSGRLALGSVATNVDSLTTDIPIEN
jgi:hypothetical protein